LAQITKGVRYHLLHFKPFKIMVAYQYFSWFIARTTQRVCKIIIICALCTEYFSWFIARTTQQAL